MQPMHAGCGWTGEGGEGEVEGGGDGAAEEQWQGGQAWASPEDIMSAVFDVQLDGPNVVEVEEKVVVPLVAPVVPLVPLVPEPDLVTATEAAHVVAHAEAEADTEAETESMVASGGMSKTRLRKMPVDVLKEMCLIRGLAAEGTKNVLVERIFDAA